MPVEDTDALPDDKSKDWGQIRTFLRSEVKQEVKYATGVLAQRLEAHDTRLEVVEASVKSIQEGVNASRWETANIAGMLSGFIGTKDVTGKFDVAIDGIKQTASRANVLAHAVRNELQTLNGRLDKYEGRREGADEMREEYDGASEKRKTWVKWILSAIGASGAGSWLLKHFRH